MVWGGLEVHMVASGRGMGESIGTKSTGTGDWVCMWAWRELQAAGVRGL